LHQFKTQLDIRKSPFIKNLKKKLTKYKKILVITSRYPFPVRGGDKLRVVEIIKELSKKNSLDLVSIGDDEKKISFINKQFIFKHNLLRKVFEISKSFLINEPLQIGLFKIPRMKNKIAKISKNYDAIIFHLIRTAYYLPSDYKGRKILEMTDLISKNYETVDSNLNKFNPLKFLYKYEKIRLKKFEKKNSQKFDTIVLVNKKDLNNSNLKKYNKSVKIVGNGTHRKKNIYINKKNKKNLIFFGNINSLANRSACFDFIKNYLPTLKLKYPNINYKILGNCSLLLKIYFQLKGVTVIRNIDQLSNFSKNSIAGICNVKIHSGLQNKILDYTSIGIPVLCNLNSNNFKFLSNNDLLIYKNKSDFFKKLDKLIMNENLRKTISNNCFLKTNKYYLWKKILAKYQSII